MRRYLRRSGKHRIAEAFRLGKLPDEFVMAADYNIARTTFQPVVRLNRDSGRRAVVIIRCGLIPYFVKSVAEFRGFSTINARAERLGGKALWRGPLERRRCLVPADGFYEWKKLTAKTKQPYAYLMRDGQPFAFAGFWDAWKDSANGEWLQTFAIITTVANELAAEVHDRMPVILHPRDYDRWLERGETHQPLSDLLRPYEAEAMKADTCNPAVGNARDNGSEMLNSM